MRKKILFAFSFLILVLSFLIIPIPAFATSMNIHVFDLYTDTGTYGDAILLESGGNYLLIDTGTNSNKILSYLNKKKIRKIDVMLSHLHGDHYGGLTNLLKSKKVRNLYMPDKSIIDALKPFAIKNGQLASYQSLLNTYNSKIKQAQNNNVSVNYLKRGSMFQFGSAKVSIIGPILFSADSVGAIDFTNHMINNFSLVAMIEVGNIKFLSCGDIEQEQENALLNSGVNLKADIFKMNHHGNDTGTTAFLQKVNPMHSFRWVAGSYSTVSYLDKNSLSFSSKKNGIIDYYIKDNNIFVNVEKNIKKITFKYYDQDSNKKIDEAVYPIQSGQTFHKNQKWYRKKIDGYKYVTTEGNSKKVNKNTTVKVYYKKTKSSNSNPGTTPNPTATLVPRPTASQNSEVVKKQVLKQIDENAAGADTYVMYGPIEEGAYVPYRLVRMIRTVFDMIRYGVPILLIVFGMVDFSKAVMSHDNDMIPKAGKKFGGRVVAGAFVFCALALIQIVFRVVGAGENVFSFINCVINNKSCVHVSLSEEIVDTSIQFPAIREDLAYLLDKVVDKTDNNSNGSNENSTKNKVIFVGDSRFVGMKDATGSDDTYVADIGKGYDWFVSTAVPRVNSIIQNSKKTYTIFIGLGINDAIYNGVNEEQVKKYVDKINDLTTGSWSKHKVVFVSVNPKVGSGSYAHISNEAIKKFNVSMKAGLNNKVAYCDTYNGIGESKFQAVSNGEIHYTGETYKMIYQYMMSRCR